MAQDVLCMTLYDLEQEEKPIPPASGITAVAHASDEFVSLVSCDTLAYRKLHARAAVKKTLSIPGMAQRHGRKTGHQFFSGIAGSTQGKAARRLIVE